jgi:hypothetical protein
MFGDGLKLGVTGHRLIVATLMFADGLKLEVIGHRLIVATLVSGDVRMYAGGVAVK